MRCSVKAGGESTREGSSRPRTLHLFNSIRFARAWTSGQARAKEAEQAADGGGLMTSPGMP